MRIYNKEIKKGNDSDLIRPTVFITARRYMGLKKWSLTLTTGWHSDHPQVFDNLTKKQIRSILSKN